MAFQPDAHVMDYMGKKTRVDRYSSKGKEGILGSEHFLAGHSGAVL